MEDGSPLYADYAVPQDLKPQAPDSGRRFTWRWFMTHWEHVSADLAQTYGVHDWQAHAIPWPTYRGLVLRLLDHPDTRLARLADMT